jgi:hypothetical protein
MKTLFPTRRTGSLAGPVLPFFLILLVLASPVLAQQGQQPLVIDSILGVGVGTSLDQAHEKLDRLSSREGRDERETRDDKQKRSHKEAWALRGTSYVTVALKVDRGGHVVWITGFVRQGKEIPFAKLGNLSSATAVTNARAIWNVATPSGGYRVIAKGQNGKAHVVSILSLARPPIE